MDDLSPNDKPSQSQQGLKRRGRPRLANAEGDPTAQRRAQIRLAQQTFLSKNHALAQKLRKRNDKLEMEAQRKRQVFSTFYEKALMSNLHNSEPELSALLKQTAELFLLEKELEILPEASPNTSGVTSSNDSCSSPTESCQALSRLLSPLPLENTIFGFQMSKAGNDKSLPLYRVEDQRSPSMPRSLSYQSTCVPVLSPTPFRQDYSYSFQESTFGRHLQRLCLEHTYRLFINPATDPKILYRVFRLVKCIADKSKMQPYFERLLHRGSNEPLELPGLPFYTIGGAGTHYQRKDLQGRLGLPENTRLPKRILGSLPFQGGTEDHDDRYVRFLEMFGYGGVWMDSCDVEAYLREKGVMVGHGTAVLPVQPKAGGVGLRATNPLSGHKNVGIDGQETEGSDHISPTFLFDVERFAEYLLRDVVMLGRAPGFRKSSVDIAIDYALRPKL
ncbi:hypothetical protein BofuT4_P071020.1 [Botrytis cinerea T4]|uniref:BZIP domain-containing protein n=1 Tax=Botryotinia fuckeliana (strain T4) TaxID=999810 RepID=G2XPR8_BOTF4|nr:hypothetical protein BofuT4_P071020.1 [Botrytis cinerea T4]